MVFQEGGHVDVDSLVATFDEVGEIKSGPIIFPVCIGLGEQGDGSALERFKSVYEQIVIIDVSEPEQIRVNL